MGQLLAHLFGDYILQSDWMAQNKTKRFLPAWIHAMVYASCFAPLCLDGSHLQWHGVNFAWQVIFLSHFLIDRYRLARYVVYAKNHLGPRSSEHGSIWSKRGADRFWLPRRYPDWSCCRATGYSSDVPVWLSTWLLIIADNTLHLTINYLALRYL